VVTVIILVLQSYVQRRRPKQSEEKGGSHVRHCRYFREATAKYIDPTYLVSSRPATGTWKNREWRLERGRRGGGLSIDFSKRNNYLSL